MATRTLDFAALHADDERENQRACAPTVVCRRIATSLLFVVSVGLFLLIGPCLCFLKMRRRVRILILWVWLVLLGIFFGFSVRFLIFPGVRHILAPFDQRPMTSRTSSIFCSALEVNSSIRTDVFSIKGDPYARMETFSYTERHDMKLAQNESAMFPFYMLPGSDVRIDVTSATPIVFTVLRGEGAVDQWMERRFESGTKTTGTKIEVKFRFGERTEYGFAFSNENFDPGGNDVGLSVIFKVNRMRMNLSHSETSCKEKHFCKLPFTFNAYQTMVVDVPVFNRSGKYGNLRRGHSYSVAPPVFLSHQEERDRLASWKETVFPTPAEKRDRLTLSTSASSHPTAEITSGGGDILDAGTRDQIPDLYYKCIPNIYVYLFVFVLIPVALGCLGTGIIYACVRDREADETLPLLAETGPSRRHDIIRKYSNVWLY